MTSKKGGKAIAAGGFGCVFKPALSCKNHADNVKNGISKLMTKGNMEDEVSEYLRVKKHIEQIPQNTNYFIVNDVKSCSEPLPLSKNDLINFDKTCSNLTRKGFKTSNINNNLKKLGIINMPYGGVDVDEFWKVSWLPEDFSRVNKSHQKDAYDTFTKTNNALVMLLKHAIIPLNKNKFYHLDIKGPNILRSTNNNVVHCKLIDWGLSGSFRTPQDLVKNYRHSVIQFNLPFGVTLLNETNLQILSELKHLIPRDYKGKQLLMNVVAQYIYETRIYDTGHDAYLKTLFNDLFKLDNKMFFSKNAIINNLAEILIKYTNSEQLFDVDKYVSEVFQHNVDAYGLIIAYIRFVRNHNINFPAVSTEVRKIIVHYCFGTKFATEPIPIDLLISDLLNLNKIFGEKEISINVNPCKSGKAKNHNNICAKIKTSKNTKTTKKEANRNTCAPKPNPPCQYGFEVKYMKTKKRNCCVKTRKHTKKIK